jgi:hypothetical protein
MKHLIVLLLLAAAAVSAQPTTNSGSVPPPSAINPNLTPYVVRGTTPPPTGGCAQWLNGRLVTTGLACGSGGGGTGAVTSVFGRAGTVVAQSGDYTTSLVTEGTSLYYTDARARAAISGAAPLLWNSGAGQMSCPTCLVSDGAYINPTWLSSITSSKISDLAAGVRAQISAVSPIEFNSGTGVISCPTCGSGGGGGAVDSVFGRTGTVVQVAGDYNTDQITEGTNQFFTQARARGAVSATSPLTYNSGTGAFGIQTASGSLTGALSSADWSTFNAKQAALLPAAPISVNGANISCPTCLVGTENYVNPSWLSGIDAAIISGLAASATLDTTNASNITSGTLGAGRLPAIPNIQGTTVESGSFTGDGQFYAYSTGTTQLRRFGFGNLLTVSGTTVNVATESVPRYSTGTSVPGSCSAYGELFFETDLGTGLKMYYCNGSTYEQIQGTGGGGGGSTVGAWSGTVNIGNLVDGACGEATFTATGVLAGAMLAPGWPSGLEAGLLPSMIASAADTIKVRLCNLSGAEVDPASATFTAQLAQGYLNASASINFGSINDAACATNTLTVTGAATGDKVSPGWPSGLETGLVGSMRVTAADTVTIQLCNLSGSSVDPASATFAAAVIK